MQVKGGVERELSVNIIWFFGSGGGGNIDRKER